MSQPPSRSRLRQAWDWLDFWSRLEPAALIDEAGKEQVRQDLRSLEAKARRLLTEVWVRQNDQVRDDLESARTRGTSLLAATGVITGVLTLLVPIAALLHGAFSPNSGSATLLLLLAGAAFTAMIYCALATVVLAIRSQEVDFWGQSELEPAAHRSAVDYELEYAFALYVTYVDNVNRLRNPVGYLRQAQVYFRVLMFALAALAVASVLAGAVGAFTVPDSNSGSQCACPSPSLPVPSARPHR